MMIAAFANVEGRNEIAKVLVETANAIECDVEITYENNDVFVKEFVQELFKAHISTSVVDMELALKTRLHDNNATRCRTNFIIANDPLTLKTYLSVRENDTNLNRKDHWHIFVSGSLVTSSGLNIESPLQVVFSTKEFQFHPRAGK